MNSRTTLFRFAVPAVLLVLAPVLGQNLLENPDFSDWSNPTQPASWTVEDSTRARIERCADTTRSSAYAARITRLVDSTGNNYGVSQLIPVASNREYTLSGWFLDDDVDASGGVGITWRKADTSFISSSGNSYTDSSIHTWQRISKTATSPATAALADVKLRVYGFPSSPAGGVVYADDAEFVLGAGAVKEERPAGHASTVFSVQPNPFPGQTRILLQLPGPQNVRLEAYDLTGSARALIHSGPLPEGQHALVWTGTDFTGRRIPAGLYFVVLTDSSGRTMVQKLILER